MYFVGLIELRVILLSFYVPVDSGQAEVVVLEEHWK